MAKRFVTARLRAPCLSRAASGHNRAMSTGSIAAKGRRAGKSPWVERLGRLGLVAKGVLYAVVGILAIKVALGAARRARQGGRAAHDRRAAVRQGPAHPARGGPRRLRALAARAGVPRPRREGEGPPGLAKRARRSRRPAWYAVLCGLTAVGRSSAATAAAETSTRRPPACSNAPSAATSSSRRPRVPRRGRLQRLSRRHVQVQEEAEDRRDERGRGAGGDRRRHPRPPGPRLVFAPDRLFLVKAAWEFDPKEARGLDGALLELSQQPYGAFLLGAVAIGLLAYGLYCFVQARYRRI